MIAVDTNVLLRYLLWDDAVQSPIAARLMGGSERVLISDAVLVEAIWTLQGKKYRLAKARVVEVIKSLLKEPNILFESPQTIWVALDHYRRSSGADFPDALIVGKARLIASELDEVFAGFYTFDKAAQRLPGARSPASAF